MSEELQEKETEQPAVGASVAEAEQSAQDSSCVKARVTVDAALQKRISKNSRIVLLCAMIVGIVMLIAYVALYVVSEEGLVVLEDDFLLDLLLWAGAILFAVGLMSLIMSGMTNRKQLSLAFVNEYEFYPEGLVINDYRAGEHVSTARLRYSDFEKIRESREFFLLYPNRVTVYPVDKALLTEEECAQLRAMLHLPAKPKKK